MNKKSKILQGGAFFAVVLFFIAICIGCFGLRFSFAFVHAEENNVVTFSEMGTRLSNNQNYSQIRSGMFHAKRQNNKEIIGKTDYFRWPEIAGCDYQNKTVIFSFRMTGENANFLVNLGGTNRNVLDGYVFHVNTWDTIHCIAIGKGADNAKDMTQNEVDMEIKLDYTAADSVWKANDLAPNDGNVYDVEISFMQNVEIDGVLYAEVLNYKILHNGLILENMQLKYNESRIKSNSFNLAVVGADVEVLCGDKNYFEGELSVEESVIDVSRIADVEAAGISSDINVYSYSQREKNQLLTFKFSSATQADIILKTNNNVAGTATLDVNCVKIGKSAISFGIDMATVPVVFQNESVTSWYKPNEIYTVEFGVLEYVKDNVITHNDIVCRIYDSNNVKVFDERQVLDPSYKIYDGFFINGVTESVKIFPAKLYREYYVFLHEADNSYTVKEINHSEPYKLNDGADLEEIGSFKNWYYMQGTEKIVVPTEGIWNFLSEEKGVADYSDKYIFHLYADYDYKFNRIEYVFSNAENNQNPEIVYALQSAELKDPVCLEGYGFFGWYDNAEFAGEKITRISYDKSKDSIKLYAKILPARFVSFEYENETVKVCVPKDEPYTLIPKEIDGYEFVKWEKRVGDEYEDLQGNEITVIEDITVRPVYTLVDYQITYHLNGAVNGENPETYNFKSEEIVLQNPTKEGYFFVGWFSNGTKISSIPTGSSGDVSLNAAFVKNYLPENMSVYTDEVFEIPVIIGLPDYAIYTVALKNSAGETVCNSDTAVISEEGIYKIEYVLDTTVETYLWTIEVQAINESVEGCKIASASVSVSDSITVNYRVVLVAGYTNPYIICKFNGQTITITDYEVQDGTFVFRMKDIAWQYMTENMDIAVRAYDANNVNHKVCEKTDYNIAKYFYGLLSLSAEDLQISAEKYDLLQTMVVDLLNLGTEAQICTDTNTDHLANSELTANWESKATIFTLPSDRYSLSGESGKDVVFESIGVCFNGKTGVEVKVKIPVDKDFSNMKAVLVIHDKQYSVNFNKLNVSIDEEYQYLSFVFDQIPMIWFDDVFTVTVFENGEAVSGALHYSVNSYFVNHQENLNKALYCCNQSLKAFYTK